MKTRLISPGQIDVSYQPNHRTKHSKPKNPHRYILKMNHKRTASMSDYPSPKRINLEQNSEDFHDNISQMSVETSPETFVQDGQKKEENNWLDEMLALAHEICKLSKVGSSEDAWNKVVVVGALAALRTCDISARCQCYWDEDNVCCKRLLHCFSKFIFYFKINFISFNILSFALRAVFANSVWLNVTKDVCLSI